MKKEQKALKKVILKQQKENQNHLNKCQVLADSINNDSSSEPEYVIGCYKPSIVSLEGNIVY